MLEWMGELPAGHLYVLMNPCRQKDRAACYSAASRLAKKGLILKRQGPGTPQLKISDKGINSLEPCIHPFTLWERQWSSIWYILAYDIPETERAYRNIVRQFLKKLRMGCFQKSVWITPHNIRRQFSVLREVGSLDHFTCLFEAKTALSMPADKVVMNAWNFDRLYHVQKRYCDIYADNLQLLAEVVNPGLNTLARLASEEMDAYRSAFALDPLLPSELLPENYLGQRVYALHKKIGQMIQERAGCIIRRDD